jgi:hypothetical protein
MRARANRQSKLAEIECIRSSPCIKSGRKRASHLDEPQRYGYEVGEGVVLSQQLATQVPILAEITAASDVCNRKYKTPAMAPWPLLNKHPPNLLLF